VTIPDTVASLRCELYAQGSRAACTESLLLAVGYGTGLEDCELAGVPCLSLPNPVLAPCPTAELWRSVRDVRRGRIGDLVFAEDGEILAGCLRCRPGADLAASTRAHFRQILTLLEERDVPHLLRVWNYLPRINDGPLDHERYRLFNSGRAQAFEERRVEGDAPPDLPASSAVGAPGEELLTVFLASTRPPLRIENPRQVSAYRYPRRYGPKAPSFSRATLAAGFASRAFYLSGTASIVGHETRHSDSLELQVRESLDNIQALIETARRGAEGWIPDLAGFDLVKVYLRHADRLAELRALLAPALAPETPVLVLEAEICRADLLVEIEGLALG